MNCNGEERRLFDCIHAGIEVHNCDHSQDAGVVCSECKKTMYVCMHVCMHACVCVCFNMKCRVKLVLNSLILYFGGFCLLLFVVVFIGNFSARRLAG